MLDFRSLRSDVGTLAACADESGVFGVVDDDGPAAFTLVVDVSCVDLRPRFAGPPRSELESALAPRRFVGSFGVVARLDVAVLESATRAVAAFFLLALIPDAASRCFFCNRERSSRKQHDRRRRTFASASDCGLCSRNLSAASLDEICSSYRLFQP